MSQKKPHGRYADALELIKRTMKHSATAALPGPTGLTRLRGSPCFSFHLTTRCSSNFYHNSRKRPAFKKIIQGEARQVQSGSRRSLTLIERALQYGLREGFVRLRWHFDWPHNYEQATKDLGPLVKAFQYHGLFDEDSRYARASVTLLLYTEAI
jgi:hypothetical protein